MTVASRPGIARSSAEAMQAALEYAEGLLHFAGGYRGDPDRLRGYEVHKGEVW